MNPDHLIKAELVPELVKKKGRRSTIGIRSADGALRFWHNELQCSVIDLSDRATFLLALDVLMARKKGGSFELDADGGWIVWCGAYKYGDSLFAFNAQDPIHALKLALEATK